MIIFVLVLGSLLFYPSAFQELGESINATILFSSNILFWSQSGYFDAPSLQKPMLHTWSLAVEEQFYIIFPLAMMLIFRYLNSCYLQWLILAFMFSLGLSVYGVIYIREAAFYLMPTRAWELLTGSILALGVLPKIAKKWQQNIIGFTGILFILLSISFYTNNTPFPGGSALLPVMGAGLIIYSGMGDAKCAVQRLLSIKPLVFIGLISYSLYLWHWPLVIFSKYLLFHELGRKESFVIIIISIALAVISWRFIEKPFRGRHPLIPEMKLLFVCSGILMMIMLSIGSVIYFLNGIPELTKASQIFGKEKNRFFHKNIDAPILVGNIKEKPCFILWGDSHAGVLFPAVDIVAKKYRISGYIVSHGNTLPILNIQHKNTEFEEEKFNNNVLAFIQKKP